MKNALIRLAITSLTLCLMLPAGAEEMPAPAEPKCPADAAPLPASEASWSTKVAAVSASSPTGLDKAEVKIGVAVLAALHHTPEVTYAKTPFKPGGSVSYGGMFKVMIADAGTYRISLGNPSWLDVISGDRVIDSIAHQRGPACSGIRKEVDFPLAPGAYVLQLSAGADAATGLIVTRLP